jgi:hypothetical protein
MRKFRQNICTLIVLVVAAVSLVPQVARADVIIIDSFQDRPNDFPLTSDTGGIGVVASFPRVLGGRGVALGVLGSSGASPATVDILLDDNKPLLQYSSQDTTAEVLNLGYGTSGASQSSGVEPLFLPVNPSADYLQLVFSAYNHANDTDMALKTTLGSNLFPNTVYATELAILSNAGPQTVDIPFTNLSGNTLDSLNFEFDAPAGTDFELGSVTLVTGSPEPASMTILAIPAMLLLRRQREARS